MTTISNKITIFISSIMNKDTENLEAERNIVIDSVRNYSPTIPWAFENTPSSDLSAEEYYLRAVKECHLYFLLLGNSITKAVLNEYDEAKKENKSIFVFLKNVTRTDECARLIKDIQQKVKYSTFGELSEINNLVVSSLDYYFSRLVKDQEKQKQYPEVFRALEDKNNAILVEEYAKKLLEKSSASFKSEVIHYLNSLPLNLRDVSKFYIPQKLKHNNKLSETIDSALLKFKQFVLLGQAGSGKTTELLYLVSRLSKPAIENQELKQIPIFISMGIWSDGDVISQIQNTFKLYGLSYERQTIDNLLERYQTTLIFDGLDEVPTQEIDSRINEIKKYISDKRNFNVIISCRTNRYISYFNLPILEIAPLQDSDIAEYISRFTQKPFSVTNYHTWKPQLQELSRSPLMLNIIANVLNKGEGPVNLADAYHKYVEFALTKRETQEKIGIDRIWKTKAITELAIYMQVNAKSYVSEDDAVKIIDQTISGAKVGFSGVDLLNAIASSELLMRDTRGYCFSHVSFREYLASQLLVKRIKESEKILDLISDPQWEPVVIFASSIYGESDEISKFLKEVLKADLYLYTRCLSSALSKEVPLKILPDDEMSRVLLNEIMEVRIAIIELWLPELQEKMNSSVFTKRASKPAIVGKYSDDKGAHLVYGYSNQEIVGNRVKLLSEFPMDTTFKSLLDTKTISSIRSRNLSNKEITIAGAHKIALEDVWSDLEEILNNQNLVEPPALVYEQTQEEVSNYIKKIDKSIILPANILVLEKSIKSFLENHGYGLLTLSVDGNRIFINGLLKRLSILRKEGYNLIGAPLLPDFDRVPEGSNWVTQFYTDETLVNHMELYFKYYLNGYSDIVRLNFSKMSKRMVTFNLLPVRVVAEVERPEPSKGFEALGSCDYYFEPLETGHENEIFVTLNKKITKFKSPSFSSYDILREFEEQLKKYGRWNSSMHTWSSSSSLGAFFAENNQIRKDIYETLLKDLKRIFTFSSF
jgi:hypothetical protein